MYKCLILALAIMILLMCVVQVQVNTDSGERFAYDTSAYIAPEEYDAYGINNPVYAP